MKRGLTIVLIMSVFFICTGTAASEDSSPAAEISDQAQKAHDQTPAVLPPIEENETQLSSVGKVYVKKFKLEGNAIFSDEDLTPITSPYEGREITAEELQEVKNKLSGYYYVNGYVNSGAIIPDQKVENGIILLNIIEGKLSQTEISENTWLRTGYILSRLDLATKDGKLPFNVNVMQDHLKLLKQDPRVKNIHADFAPGLERGEGILNVQVEEARPYHLTLRFNNHNSPSIGPYRGEAELQHLNLTGWGDSLTAQYALTEGLDDYSVNYTVPLTRRDTTLSFDFDRSESVVVSEAFEELDIKSDTTTYAAALRHPFYKSLSSEFAMGIRFEKRHTETSLLGRGFAFPDSGADEETGETDFTMIRFSQEWVNRSLVQVVAAYSSVNMGNVDEGKYEGGFFTWVGQFQWLRRLRLFNSQLLFSLNMQLSDSSLISAEKFAIGGSSTVRGYRENQMTPDNGLTTYLEWRIPVMQLKIPGLSKGPNDGTFQLCPFFDFGKGWNTESNDPDPDNIYSAGIGARWSVNERISAEIYWGESLKDVEESGEYDIQDDGVHFQINVGLF
ncbi:ShlB/FhaC/HecB family hemolysin secretion/activation protein [Desulfonema magnum]|uniref:ShlB/FhaC/HecB family hemolysin secretion/activation protein n=1 Tax=Desulfonema magnum TaxID=45655 RepID=UPI001A9B883F|nr:ShlB/FhaC/HecB family hemolysin secretion/activation protein [Desulfonema magnum]